MQMGRWSIQAHVSSVWKNKISCQHFHMPLMRNEWFWLFEEYLLPFEIGSFAETRPLVSISTRLKPPRQQFACVTLPKSAITLRYESCPLQSAKSCQVVRANSPKQESWVSSSTSIWSVPFIQSTYAKRKNRWSPRLGQLNGPCRLRGKATGTWIRNVVMQHCFPKFVGYMCPSTECMQMIIGILTYLIH